MDPQTPADLLSPEASPVPQVPAQATQQSVEVPHGAKWLCLKGRLKEGERKSSQLAEPLPSSAALLGLVLCSKSEVCLHRPSISLPTSSLHSLFPLVPLFLPPKDPQS